MTAAFEVPLSAGTSGAAVSFSRDGFFAGLDADESEMPRRGPGDSHYELTFTLGDPSGETDLDWPADAGADAFGDEGPSGEVVAPQVPADPWSYRLIASSGRLLFCSALGFAVLSLPLLGFLLVRILGGSPAASSTLALVVGSVVAISFLFISLAMTAVTILLVDLARNLRGHRDPSARATGIVRG